MASTIDNDLHDSWGASADYVYAVGRSALTSGCGLVLHCDGFVWNEMDLSCEGELGGALNGLWGTLPDSIYALGNNRVGGYYVGLVFHFNGFKWRRMESITSNPLRDDMARMDCSKYFEN